MKANMFVFTKDFANNWVKGQKVVCETKEDGNTLVDGIALIPTEELLKHGEYKSKEVETQAVKEVLKGKAFELIYQLHASELPYEDSIEVKEYILSLLQKTI